ncbi:hypothetical protein G3435_13065, partial [Pseudomonas sp. MAFF212428]|nr:hypothetical protein [Pseudomonas brassicae]
MPVASNPLLQPAAVAKPSRAPGTAPDKVPQAANDKASGFSKVYAEQSRDKPSAKVEVPAGDKAADPATAGKPATQDERKVADSGNDLPDDRVDGEQVEAATDEPQLLDSSLVAGQVTDAQGGAQLIQAQAEAVAPVVQAAAAQLQVQAQAPAVVAQPEPQRGLRSRGRCAARPAGVRLALEQSAQAQGTTRHTPARLPQRSPKRRRHSRPSIPWRPCSTRARPIRGRVSRAKKPSAGCSRMASRTSRGLPVIP